MLVICSEKVCTGSGGFPKAYHRVRCYSFVEIASETKVPFVDFGESFVELHTSPNVTYLLPQEKGTRVTSLSPLYLLVYLHL